MHKCAIEMAEVMCQLCESEKAAVECLSCKIGQKMCPSCYKATHHGDNKRIHQVKLMQKEEVLSSYAQVLATLSMQSDCPTHPKKPVEYVCRQCDAIICCDCLLIGEHKGHDAVTFEEACKGLHKHYEELLAKCKAQGAKLAELKAVVIQRTQDRENKFAAWKKAITEGFHTIRQALDQKEKQMLLSLEEEKSNETTLRAGLFKEIQEMEANNGSRTAQFETIVKNKLTLEVYKKAKGELPKSIEDRQLDIEKYFAGNRNVIVSIDTAMSSIDKIVAIESSAPQKKHKPPVDSAKYCRSLCRSHFIERSHLPNLFRFQPQCQSQGRDRGRGRDLDQRAREQCKRPRYRKVRKARKTRVGIARSVAL
jgi:hypothetical protein